MNIYDKIDSIFSGEVEDKPKWATELLNELRDIKQLLLHQQKVSSKIDKNFYDFVKEFRLSMRANIQNNIYPTIVYNNRRYGVNFKGLLYDKESSSIIDKNSAFEIYKYAYSQQNNCKIHNAKQDVI